MALNMFGCVCIKHTLTNMSKINNKTPERRRRCSSVFIGNFEHVSHVFIVLV